MTEPRVSRLATTCPKLINKVKIFWKKIDALNGEFQTRQKFHSWNCQKNSKCCPSALIQKLKSKHFLWISRSKKFILKRFVCTRSFQKLSPGLKPMAWIQKLNSWGSLLVKILSVESWHSFRLYFYQRRNLNHFGWQEKTW